MSYLVAKDMLSPNVMRYRFSRENVILQDHYSGKHLTLLEFSSFFYLRVRAICITDIEDVD